MNFLKNKEKTFLFIWNLRCYAMNFGLYPVGIRNLLKGFSWEVQRFYVLFREGLLKFIHLVIFHSQALFYIVEMYC